ncbi:MAG TPA: lipid-binding SYLF domain-containing protein [Kofleriaceae bacterium]|nr:lipid-binding SYLF domain-containing protein [Kofleriaceae bacterium]
MSIKSLSSIAALVIGIAACAGAPKTPAEQQSLEARAEATLGSMKSRDPGLPGLLGSAYGYAVFPDIGKGGVVVGAAYGRGVLFEHGHATGYIELNQGSIGAQLGGQTFAELIVFRDRFAVEKLKAGQFELGANASAVVLTAGASGAANFTDGIAVFTVPQGGLMAELSVSGQKLDFQPRG